MYKDIYTLSILKFGQKINIISKTKKFGAIPSILNNLYNEYYKSNRITKISSSYETKQIFEDILKIEVVCFLFLEATQNFRILQKGGNVSIQKHDFKIRITDDLHFLIDLYDTRALNANLFCHVGSFYDSISDDKNIICLSYRPNFNKKLDSLIFDKTNLEIKTHKVKTNYLIQGINIKDIVSFFKNFEEDFKDKYSFTIEDFVVFLSYYSSEILSRYINDIPFQFNINNTAYSIINKGLDEIKSDFIANYSSEYKRVFNYDCIESSIVQNQIDYLFDYFVLTELNRTGINLWTRGPKKMIITLEKNLTLYEYTSIVDIIAHITKEISVTEGKSSQNKGEYFENAVVKALISNYNTDKRWISQRDIRVDKRNKQQIDATLIIEDVLFIIEAKATNVSFSFDKGDSKAIDFRNKKIQKAINQVNKTALFIQKNHKKLTIPLPKEVKFLCPIIISPFNEYIWEKSEELFISYNPIIPRIITIEDIPLLEKIDLKMLKTKKWVLEINN